MADIANFFRTNKKNGYKEGDIVNSGFAKTLKIIKHRNTLLIEGLDGGSGELISPKELPMSIGDLVEKMYAIQSSEDLVNMGETNKSKWMQIYYPAASVCYHYEPKVNATEKLSEDFIQGNWFMPCAGQLARLYWYQKYGNFFSEVVGIGFELMTGSVYACTQQTSPRYQWHLQVGSGWIDYDFGKYNSFYVRPICAF